MKKQVTGFLDFIREQGIVGLAIGLILGLAVKDVVSGLVDGLIDPLVGLVLPNADNLAKASFSVGDAEFVWGKFASPLLDLLIVAGVIYFILKGIGLDKLDKEKE